MLIKQAPGTGQHVAKLVGCRLVTQIQFRIEQDLVTACEILHVHGGQGAVGNGKLSALHCSNACGAQADVLHCANTSAEVAGVADPDDFIAEQGYTAEEILDGFLCAEADRQAADAKAGEGGRHVEA